MNKFINLLSFFLVIILLILGNLLINQYNTSGLLPISYAETAKHNNDNYNLIVSILKDTNKNKLIKYADYFELTITENIPNLPKSKIAFSLSLPEKVSFIAIYDKIDNNNYKFEYLIDNLSTINNFYFYNEFLIVEQADNNSSNDFSEKKFFEIFIREDYIFKSIFTKNTYSEKIFKYNDDNYKEIENASIDYIPGEIPEILCIVTVSTYKNELPAIGKDNFFEEISQSTKKEIYSFDYSTNKFILSKEEILR